MMRKASFQSLDTFYDPYKQATGSRNTSVQVISTQYHLEIGASVKS